MRTFRDKDGMEWHITVNVSTIRRVRDNTAGTVDLFEPNLPESKPVSSLMYADTMLWYDVLWYVLMPQAEKAGVTEEQFGERMAAECLLTARELFYEEWRSFLLGLQHHESALSVEAMAETYKRATAQVKEKLETMKVREQIKEKAEQIMSGKFGELQAKLDSFQAHTLYGN